MCVIYISPQQVGTEFMNTVKGGTTGTMAGAMGHTQRKAGQTELLPHASGQHTENIPPV